MNSNHSPLPHAHELIRVVPRDVYLQDVENNGELVGELHLINPTPNYLTFKIKTNAMHKYSVKPVMGILVPNGRKTIGVKGIKRLWAEDHQFLLQVYPLSRFEVNEWTHIKWKSLDSDLLHQVVMNCFIGTPPTPIGDLEDVPDTHLSFRTAKLHLPPEPIQLEPRSPKLKVRSILMSRDNTLVEHEDVDNGKSYGKTMDHGISRSLNNTPLSLMAEHDAVQLKVSENYDKLLNQQVLILSTQALLLTLTICLPITLLLFVKITGMRLQFIIG